MRFRSILLGTCILLAPLGAQNPTAARLAQGTDLEAGNARLALTDMGYVIALPEAGFLAYDGYSGAQDGQWRRNPRTWDQHILAGGADHLGLAALRSAARDRLRQSGDEADCRRDLLHLYWFLADTGWVDGEPEPRTERRESKEPKRAPAPPAATTSGDRSAASKPTSDQALQAHVHANTPTNTQPNAQPNAHTKALTDTAPLPSQDPWTVAAGGGRVEAKPTGYNLALPDMGLLEWRELDTATALPWSRDPQAWAGRIGQDSPARRALAALRVAVRSRLRDMPEETAYHPCFLILTRFLEDTRWVHPEPAPASPAAAQARNTAPEAAVPNSRKRSRPSAKGKFICRNCARHFTTEDYLARHKAIHQRGHKFMCSFPGCEATFAKPALRDEHELIHSDLRPWQCQTCPKAFNRKSNLKKHLLNVHGLGQAEAELAMPALPVKRKSPDHANDPQDEGPARKRQRTGGD